MPSCKLLGAIFARLKNDLQITNNTTSTSTTTTTTTTTTNTTTTTSSSSLSNETHTKIINLIESTLDLIAELDRDDTKRQVLQLVLVKENILDLLHYIVKNSTIQQQRLTALKAMECSFDNKTKQSIITWKWKPDYITTLETIIKEDKTNATLLTQAQKVLDLVNGTPSQSKKTTTTTKKAAAAGKTTAKKTATAATKKNKINIVFCFLFLKETRNI
eukprot:UN01771